MRVSTKIVEHIDGLEFTKSADDALRSRCLNIMLPQDGAIVKATCCVLFSHML